MLATNSGWRTLEAGLLPAAILGQQATEGFSIQQGTNATGLLFHHRRQLADGQLLFLVNTSLEAPAAGWVDTTALGVEEWDTYTGAVNPYVFEKAARGSRFSFELSPGGSRLLFLSEKPLRSAPAIPGTGLMIIRVRLFIWPGSARDYPSLSTTRGVAGLIWPLVYPSSQKSRA